MLTVVPMTDYDPAQSSRRRLRRSRRCRPGRAPPGATGRRRRWCRSRRTRCRSGRSAPGAPPRAGSAPSSRDLAGTAAGRELQGDDVGELAVRRRRSRPGPGRSGSSRPARRPWPTGGRPGRRRVGRRGARRRPCRAVAPRSRRCRAAAAAVPAATMATVPVATGSGSVGRLEAEQEDEGDRRDREGGESAARHRIARLSSPDDPAACAISEAAASIGMAKPRPSALVETAVLTPMTLPRRVQQRPAAVAGVDRGVGLEQVRSA